jgi:hypothetical protein
VIRLAARLALLATLMIVVDSLWCADGCTDDPAAAQAAQAAPCAVCQRSIPPASDVVPVPSATRVVIVTMANATAPLPDAWEPTLDHPPRFA